MKGKLKRLPYHAFQGLFIDNYDTAALQPDGMVFFHGPQRLVDKNAAGTYHGGQVLLRKKRQTFTTTSRSLFKN